MGNISTVYPYIYHQISVNEQKDVLKKYGWKTPCGSDAEGYISSGCEIMSYIIGELEKLGLITLNEREQAKAMVQAGLIDKNDLEFANYDASKDVVDLTSPIMKRIGVKEYLRSLCIKLGREYKE